MTSFLRRWLTTVSSHESRVTIHESQAADIPRELAVALALRDCLGLEFEPDSADPVGQAKSALASRFGAGRGVWKALLTLDASYPGPGSLFSQLFATSKRRTPGCFDEMLRPNPDGSVPASVRAARFADLVALLGELVRLGADAALCAGAVFEELDFMGHPYGMKTTQRDFPGQCEMRQPGLLMDDAARPSGDCTRIAYCVHLAKEARRLRGRRKASKLSEISRYLGRIQTFAPHPEDPLEAADRFETLWRRASTKPFCHTEGFLEMKQKDWSLDPEGAAAAAAWTERFDYGTAANAARVKAIAAIVAGAPSTGAGDDPERWIRATSELCDFVRMADEFCELFSGKATVGLRELRAASRIWHSAPKNLALGAKIKIQTYDNARLDMELDGYKFEQVKDSTKLAEEGKKMRHCVFCYDEDAAAGRAAIVSMTRNGERTLTLRLRRVDSDKPSLFRRLFRGARAGDPWSFEENRGKSNRSPTAEEKALCQRWFAAAMERLRTSAPNAQS